jgi:hypothetical protein
MKKLINFFVQFSPYLILGILNIILAFLSTIFITHIVKGSNVYLVYIFSLAIFGFITMVLMEIFSDRFFDFFYVVQYRLNEKLSKNKKRVKDYIDKNQLKLEEGIKKNQYDEISYHRYKLIKELYK